MNGRLLLIFLCGSFFSLLTVAQNTRNAGTRVSIASPEMAKLANALTGEWNNVETMEPSENFPNGGERRGVSSCRLATGGTTLVCEGNSDGSAGKLSHLIAIWWDKDSNRYGFFTCFKDRGSGCEVRGTAHWEGDIFVNDYTENVNGEQTKMRDSFIDITPNSHTLVFTIETAGGKMKTLITTKSTRR